MPSSHTPRTPLRRTRSFDGHQSYNSNSSVSQPGFLSFRARQFGNSITPTSIDNITPIQRALPLWSPEPTPIKDGTEHKTPILCPSQSPGDNHNSNLSMNSSFISNDTPPQSTNSVRGVANGGILVGKIRDLQRQLSISEKEKEDMQQQIKVLQEKEKESNTKLTTIALRHSTTEEIINSRRSSTGSSTNNTINEEQNCSISSSNLSTDETMIQNAMTSINSGVNQLQGALRRLSRSGGSIAGSTGSYQKHLDLGNSTNSTNSTGTTGTTLLHGDVVCGHGTPSWWSRLQCGDMIDGRDKDREWYVACVESIESCNNDGDEEQFRILISFEGWSSEWDIWLHSERDVAELAPRGTHVCFTHKEENDKLHCQQNNTDIEDIEDVNDEEDNQDNKDNTDNEHNVSLAPAEDDDDVNLSNGSTQIGETPEQRRRNNSATKSWNNDLSPVEYVQSLGGSLESQRMEGSPLKREMLILRKETNHRNELDLSPRRYLSSSR